MMRNAEIAVVLVVVLACSSCKKEEAPPSVSTPTTISTDAQLFRLVTQNDPFGSYSLFPHADSVTTGTLNGSQAHQPQVRVSMNSTAQTFLLSGRFPAGGTFPDGSVIFKQIRTNNQTTLYAVLYKDSANPLGADGWLWAEYRPDGSVAFSLAGRGSGCVGCHQRDGGLQHDRVRTFERQR